MCVGDHPHVITAADVNAGNVHNVATGHGTPPGDTPIDSPPDTTDTPVDVPNLPNPGGNNHHPTPHDPPGFLPNTGGPALVALVGGGAY